MKVFFKISLCLILILVFYISSSQNSDYILNNDFNSEYLGDSPPPPKWHVCDAYADVDIETNTISENNIVNPVSGNTFIMMRARGVTYNEPNSWDHLKSTREYISQKLNKPLESNSMFIFTAYLRHSPTTTFNDIISDNVNISNPLQLIVLAGNDSCSIDRLLLTTKTVTNTDDWEKHELRFSTGDTAFNYIKIQVQWDHNIKTENYNGELMLDSVNIIYDCKNKDTIYHDVNFLGNFKTQLTASTMGNSYEWSPASNFDPENSPVTTMKHYTKDVTVKVIQDNDCPTYEKFNIHVNCDLLYPKDTATFYYTYFEPVVLKADSTGSYYDWNPKRHLSDYSSCCPTLTDFDTMYTVHIKYDYGCEFINIFKIVAECDKLVPGGTAIVLDATLRERTRMLLEPKVGKALPNSWTPLDYLEVAPDFQSAIANPINEKTYYVTVEDSFMCQHIEGFHIFIELKVPNVITPNGDGYNDLFVIPGLPDRTALKIFDRNGSVLFLANPYSESNYWDGRDKNGKPISSGTYWYVLDNPTLGVIKKGFVMIIR